VGNLTFGVTERDLLQLFEPFRKVESAQVIMDRESGRSKGFGFVEMGSDQEAQAAIQALSGKDHGGRALTVNETGPKTEGGGAGVRYSPTRGQSNSRQTRRAGYWSPSFMTTSRFWPPSQGAAWRLF
jgi:RNA recognition motif-containing protein